MMRTIRFALAALFAVMAFSAMASSAAAAVHPLFLTQSKSTLLFIGEGNNPVLRGLNAGIAATINCQKVLIHGFVLHESSLVHLLGLLFENKCTQTSGSTTSECNPLHITTKPILGELGLIKQNTKPVVILLAPSDGTTVFAEFTCGGIKTTVEGTIVGEIPELNALGEKQYNEERTELEVIFATKPAGTDQQAITTIFLLGSEMTGQELKVAGFLGGKAAEEATSILKADGKVKIDV